MLKIKNFRRPYIISFYYRCKNLAIFLDFWLNEEKKKLNVSSLHILITPIHSLLHSESIIEQLNHQF